MLKKTILLLARRPPRVTRMIKTRHKMNDTAKKMIKWSSMYSLQPSLFCEVLETKQMLRIELFLRMKWRGGWTEENKSPRRDIRGRYYFQQRSHQQCHCQGLIAVICSRRVMECTHCKMQEEIIFSGKVARSEMCYRGEKLNFTVYHWTCGCVFEHCFLEIEALEWWGPSSNIDCHTEVA